MSAISDTRRRFKNTRVSRFLQARWRLLFATLVFLLIALLLPSTFAPVMRMLIGWDVGTVLYLLLVAAMIRHSDVDQIRRDAALQDDGRTAIPILTVTAAMASLGAIVFLLRTSSASGGVDPVILAVMLLTTVLSWVFVHVMFALHYAHEFYAEHRSTGGGMRFPDTDEPNYWDFIYFAFVIGTSTAVSDVAITSRAIRRTVTAHGMIAFAFNVTTIALTVSIAGDAIFMK